MDRREPTNTPLSFENLESLKAPELAIKPTAYAPDKNNIGLDSYLRYFLEYKRIILVFSCLSFLFIAAIFQNKDYKVKMGFKVEAGQDLTSNILSESLLGVKSSKNSLGNITERAFVKAQSVSFYEELAKATLSEEKFGYIKYKLGEERKGWVEFAKEQFFSKPHDEHEEYLLNRVSEHLEKIITVNKKADSNLFFNIKTKNKKLTKEVLDLVKLKAGEILIKDPLTEAYGALKILEETEVKIFRELDSLSEKALDLQKQHGTLSPEELPQRYSSMRFEMEKGILENLIQEKAILGKLSKLNRDKNNELAGYDFEAKKRQESLKQDLAATKNTGNFLVKELNELDSNFKDLPLFSAEVEKIHLRKKILMEKIQKLTEQISLAKISYEKVKSSLSNLNLSERIEQTGTLKILTKTIVTGLTLITLFLALLYYKQSLFPLLLRKEDLEQNQLKLAAIFPKKNKRIAHMGESLHSDPRAMAMGAFYQQHIKGSRWFALAPICANSDFAEEFHELAGHLIGRGHKVCLYNLSSMDSKSKRLFRKMESAAPELFTFKTEQACDGQKRLANKKRIRKFLNSRPNDELVFIWSPNLEKSPNTLIISQITDKTFVNAKLFTSSASSIRNLLKQHARLPSQLREKFAFTLSNANPYDDINTFIPNSNASGDDNENPETDIKSA